MTTFAYQNACGPSAFAAITSTARNEAARDLIRWNRRFGLPLTGQPGNTWTDVTVLAAALLARGHRLERWSTQVGGWRIESAEVFSARIWRLVKSYTALFDELREINCRRTDSRKQQPEAVQQRVGRALKTHAAREEARRRNRYTLAEWLHRRRIGTWLLIVEGHALVARQGRIVTGDTPDARDCGSETLHDAWRVLPSNI